MQQPERVVIPGNSTNNLVTCNSCYESPDILIRWWIDEYYPAHLCLPCLEKALAEIQSKNDYADRYPDLQEMLGRSSAAEAE